MDYIQERNQRNENVSCLGQDEYVELSKIDNRENKFGF